MAGILKGGVDEIKEWMPLIGDLAAASGSTIQESTDQVSRMLSAGAGVADLFRDRGILAMLGFQSGVSYSATETRKRLMAEWKKTDSQFRGATDKLARTWDGLMSMFGDKWFAFRNTVMDAGVFEEMKTRARGVLDELNTLEADGTLQKWAESTAEYAMMGARHVDDFALALMGLYAARRVGPMLQATTARMLAFRAQTQAVNYLLPTTAASVRRVTFSLRAMTSATNFARGALAALGGPAY